MARNIVFPSGVKAGPVISHSTGPLANWTGSPLTASSTPRITNIPAFGTPATSVPTLTVVAVI